MKYRSYATGMLIAIGVCSVATGLWAVDNTPTSATIKDRKPLVAPAVLDSDPASEAHLKLGWGVFHDKQDWDQTKVAQDKNWLWNTDGSRPIPSTGAFAVVTAEFVTRKETPITTAAKLVIGAHFDLTETGFDKKLPGVVDGVPNAKNHNDNSMEGRLMSRFSEDGNSVFLFYKDGTLLRTLWSSQCPRLRTTSSRSSFMDANRFASRFPK